MHRGHFCPAHAQIPVVAFAPIFPTGQIPATFLYTTYDNPAFARDVRSRVWESATVTYVALQLAFHMGFEQVILVGVDHNSNVPGKANSTIVSQGDDPNHFHPRLFRQRLPLAAP